MTDWEHRCRALETALAQAREQVETLRRLCDQQHAVIERARAQVERAEDLIRALTGGDPPSPPRPH